jgi:hypothetical protein
MRSRVFLLLVPLLFALAAPALAEHDGETLDRILPDIRAAHPGRLSDAQPWVDDSGRTHYRIKWMTPEGRILFFDADPRTGRFSNSAGGDGENWRGGSRGSGSEPGSGYRPAPSGDSGRHHDNFSGGAGDWQGGNWNGGGDWRGRGGGDWRDRGGDWRGGHGTGDNGGWHHNGSGGH